MNKPKVFVIMPFEDKFFEVYETLKVHFENDFIFSNAGDESSQQNILRDIVQPIHDADVVIADLTGLNPNVMYELALSHAFNKKTIIITQDELSSLPFDLRTYRAKSYDVHFKRFEELVKYLEKNMNGALDGSVLYGNPVMDFLSVSQRNVNISDTNQQGEEANVADAKIEKGFLDFVADLNSNITAFADTTTDLGNDMETLTKEIVTNMPEMKHANGNVASVAYKNIKKIASSVDIFDRQLRKHNKRLVGLWDDIERDTIGLLENKFSVSAANIAYTKEYIQSLIGLKDSVSTSSSQIANLRESMKGSIGIERSMTQAVRFTIADLSTFLDLTEKIISSIDKIQEKSKSIID